jgi:hypothetical protein
LLEYETGDFAKGEAYLEQLLEAIQGAGPDRLLASDRVSLAIAAAARITGVPNRLEIAEAAGLEVLRSDGPARLETRPRRRNIALIF